MRRRALLLMALLVVTTTGCTTQEIAAWIAWHDEAPDAAQIHLARPEVQESLHQDWDHDGVIEPEPVAQADPPAPSLSSASSSGRCTGIIDALVAQSPGWDVNRMAAIAYRESRCQPGASNSCCSGLFQVHAIWIPKAASCGVYSRSDLYNSWKNICVASIIYRTQGMGAWSTS